MSACFVSPAVVNLVFYNAPALNALPVHLLRQVYFFDFFCVFFCVGFLCVFWEALRGPLGALGSIWEPFGEHFGVIFVIFSG